MNLYQSTNPYLQNLQGLQNQLAPIVQPSAPQAAPIQYVKGQKSAEAYQLAPNTSVVLFDEDLDRFYLKRADASGFASVEAYDFTKAKDEPAPSVYVTKAEFSDFRKSVEDFINKSTKSPTKVQRGENKA